MLAMALLEIACFTTTSAFTAWSSGADRIELCEDQPAGGTTPAFESLMEVKKSVKIPVFVMIRPRSGDFNYTDLELEHMKASIDTFKPCVDGYVFGVLDSRHKVDIDKTAELVRRAHPLPCTFHRAFDETQDYFRSLEDIVSAGCHAILTSGGRSTALAGANVLSELVQRAQGRITIIPGGSVRATNIDEIRSLTEASIYHSSGIAEESSEPEPNEIRRMKMILTDSSSLRTNMSENPAKQKLNTKYGVNNDVGNADPRLRLTAVSNGANTPISTLR